MLKISIDHDVLQFKSNSPEKTLRQTLLEAGVWIDGITSNSGFSMNGNRYIVSREKGLHSGLYFMVHTTENDPNNPSIEPGRGTVTVYNTEKEDDLHRLMFSALLQYDAQQFYNQLHKNTKQQPALQEQDNREAA